MYKKGEWIAVSLTGMGWQIRQFDHIDDDGKFVCLRPTDPALKSRWNNACKLSIFIKDNEGLKDA